jgi:hypothetical protein
MLYHMSVVGGKGDHLWLHIRVEDRPFSALWLLLVQNPPRHLLVQPPEENHRPLQVLRHPRLLGAAAATDGLLQGGEDSTGDISLLRGERNLEIVAGLEAELSELMAAEGDRLRAGFDRQAACRSSARL